MAWSVQGENLQKFFDSSETDAGDSHVLSGKKYVGASGESTGSMTNNGATGGTIVQAEQY